MEHVEVTKKTLRQLGLMVGGIFLLIGRGSVFPHVVLAGCEENYVDTLDRRSSARVAQQEKTSAGCSKRPFSKAAASEGPRRTLWGARCDE